MLAITTTSSLALFPVSSLKQPLDSIRPIYRFPDSSVPTSIAWSPDGASLYVTSSSSLNHFTSSGELINSIALKGGADNLLARDKSTLVYSIPGTSKIHVLSLSTPEKPQIIDTHKAPNVITSLSLSNDGTLLASTSVNGVHVHNLTLNSHTVMRAVPAGGITTSAFHPHARTRLLLGIRAQLAVYDTTRPSSPIKVIPMTSDDGNLGVIVDITCSPFSKTLVAVAMSGGWIGLVDLGKEKSLFRVLPTHMPLTTLTFAPSGASLVAGTENGKVLVIDLRALDRMAGTVFIGDGSAMGSRIMGLAIQSKIKAGTETERKPASATSHTTITTAKSDAIRRDSVSSGPPSIPVNKRSLPPSPARPKSTTAGKARTLPPHNVSGKSGANEKGKDNTRPPESVGGKGTDGAPGKEKSKKPFSPVRDPLGNILAGAKGDPLRDDYPSIKQNPLRNVHKLPPTTLVEKEDQDALTLFEAPSHVPASKTRTSVLNGSAGRFDKLSRTRTRTISGTSCEGASSAVSGAEPATIKSRPQSGTTVGGESISAKSRLNHGSRSASERPGDQGRPESSTASRAAEKLAAFSSVSANARSKLRKSASATPLSFGIRDERISHGTRTPSPDLISPSKEPFTPCHKAGGKGGQVLDTPQVHKGKGKDKTKNRENRKKVGFMDDGDGEKSDEEIEDEELSVVISPRRRPSGTQNNTWAIPSPLLRSQNRSESQAQIPSPSVNAPQDLLRSLLSDVLYEHQRIQHADMVGLHLDLVRMGRGWVKELESVKKELAELRAENRELREENGRLRRGY